MRLGALRCTILLYAAFLALPLAPQTVHADTFAAGSLIIPMDNTYQNAGTLSAFGLLDKLLRAGVPVRWCILPGKTISPPVADFTASAKDFKTNALISAYGYRGGPFVVDAADAATASPIVAAWQVAHPSVNVHVAAAAFTATVRLLLTASPRLAVFEDGNQAIIISYLNAAGINDGTGVPWSNSSPGMLTPASVGGPSPSLVDGALFDSTGVPVYSALLFAHWSNLDPAIAYVWPELAAFLHHPALLFAECQSVITIEDYAGGGLALTTAGVTTSSQPTSVQFSNSDSPFAQMDGAFLNAGGSQPSFNLGASSSFIDGGVEMVRGAGQLSGAQDIWMAGYMKGTCAASALGSCGGAGPLGRVAYLGGHQYTTSTPMSTNPRSQGTRLFLNALFAGTGTIAEAQPALALTVAAPDTVPGPSLTVTITCANGGNGAALSPTLRYSLPAGASFVSATAGGTCTSNVVTWNLGARGAGSSVDCSVTMALPNPGTYASQATLSYKVGLTPRVSASNTHQTTYLGPLAVDDHLSLPLALTVSANPAMSGRMGLRFCVPQGERALLVVCDVSGRLLLSRRFDTAGWHTADAGESHRLAPGIYFARLATATHSLTVRGVVAE